MECAKEPLEIFQRNFNAESFDRIKQSIETAIEKSNGVDNLLHSLAKIQGVQHVEYSEDDDLENEDFVPGYTGEEEDSCDFLVILCYAELENNTPQYAEVCFFIVYNDVQQVGWIDAASLAVFEDPTAKAREICYFDIDLNGHIVQSDDMEVNNQD